MESKIRVPAIVTDIDGVLVKLKHAIPGVEEGIRFLQTPLKDIDRDQFANVNDKIPFACLTNAGGHTERHKAEHVSNTLGLKDSERLTGDQIVMNFTPLRPVFEQYKEKLVLLGGVGDIVLLGPDFGLKKFITDEEYCALFPNLVPYRGRPHEGEEVEALRKKIALRLGITDETEFNEPFQVHAIFMINDPIKWDERVQIICDLLSTSDGRIAHKMPTVGPADHIPVYCTNNDLIYAGTFRIPRITFGCFNQTLKEVYKLLYKRNLEINMYGKPCKSTFDYVEKHMRSLTKLEIGNFYMIGDNPKSDIRGGNNAGWTTILVKTGVFHPTEEHPNDPEDPATYVVEDFVAAIKLICEIEGIKYDIN